MDRQMYTLTDWVVEKRADGWYYTMYRHRKNRRDWHGPYRSEASVALMVARQLRREIENRHAEAA
jgi:hypothetical protein